MPSSATLSPLCGCEGQLAAEVAQCNAGVPSVSPGSGGCQVPRAGNGCQMSLVQGGLEFKVNKAVYILSQATLKSSTHTAWGLVWCKRDQGSKGPNPHSPRNQSRGSGFANSGLAGTLD